MDLVITTGDSADNAQRNETEWVVRLLEGGPLDPNSGVSGTCGVDPAEAPRYTGVSDADDFVTGTTEFYDPDAPTGLWAGVAPVPGPARPRPGAVPDGRPRRFRAT